MPPTATPMIPPIDSGELLLLSLSEDVGNAAVGVGAEDTVGTAVGVMDGALDGTTDGLTVGTAVGDTVGAAVMSITLLVTAVTPLTAEVSSVVVAPLVVDCTLYLTVLRKFVPLLAPIADENADWELLPLLLSAVAAVVKTL